MKKSLILLLLVLALLISGCQKKEPSVNIDINIEGSIFTGIKQGRVTTKLIYDDTWLTSEDNTTFNPDLAKVANILSTDSYYREKDLEKNTQNRVLVVGNDEEYDYSLIFKALGFNDVEHIESFKQKEYEYDTNDSVTMNLAYKNIDDKYDAFIVVIRGCFSAGEWNSIFDCGSADNIYNTATGNHPEWENKDIHKDIDIAAKRAKEFIEEFVNKYDTDKPNTMLLTGHSRGGTIANILGSELEENNYAKMYTYAFNPMKATLSPKENKTIFNIFDSNDFFVDLLPFKNEQYGRNGVDITVDINNDETIKNNIKELNKADYVYVPRDFLDSYKTIFEKMFVDRNSVYVEKEIERKFPDPQSAQEKLDELISLADSSHLGLDDIMSFSQVEEDDGQYEFEIEYNGATLLRGIGKILAYGTSAGEGLQAIFEGDADACELYALLTNNIAVINGGHYLINSYFIEN